MECRLSVRELVEFLYKSGDLSYTPASIERANLGSRIHRLLQSQGKGNYQSEVYLKLETELDTINFIIDGRADGIFKEEDNIILEEIKTTAIPYDEIDDSNFLHFAQAYCYAHIYVQQNGLDNILVQLTYYQIETKQTKTFRQVKTKEELLSFYTQTLSLYLRWAKLTQKIRMNSALSLKSLVFPFENYRSGQREFVSGVYKTILDKRSLFAQAPTGIGKTISTLFPSLKAIGEGKAEKIFYLCAKNITSSVVYNTLNLLYEQKLPFKSVGITAKDKICFLEERNCDPHICPYAKRYYSRNKDALYELLSNEDLMDKEILSQYAKKHSICPFELSLDASLYADLIVCDYNYVFDPRVYLKRFFMEKGNYIFLVDEAHNLVDRAREMYSAVLSKSSFQQLSKYIPKEEKQLHSSIKSVLADFKKLSSLCEDNEFYASNEPQLSILEKIDHFIEHCDGYLQSEHDDTYDEDIKVIYFNAVNYLRISDYYDENFVTWIHKENKDVTIKQFCMNPRTPLKSIMEKGRTSVLFSATLSPIDYYLDLLGGEDETNRLSLPSPFHKEQSMILINNAISTKYKNRSLSLPSLISYLHAVILSKKGNYIVFCPSYAYMEQIHDAFTNEYPDIQTTIQKENLSEDEKKMFLNQFSSTQKLHVYFCVLGGMFSEGIDLKGDLLIGTILIGVGLPQINPQQELLKEHFQKEKKMGYAYAYQFPGMNKILQAAGRVIRSVHDKGVIVFIDERFTTPPYKRLFPNHLQHYQIINEPQKAYLSLLSFWNS